MEIILEIMTRKGHHLRKTARKESLKCENLGQKKGPLVSNCQMIREDSENLTQDYLAKDSACILYSVLIVFVL